MRQIKYVATNEVVVVDDQTALDAIMSGVAVESIDPISAVEPKAAVSAPELASFAQAPEVK